MQNHTMLRQKRRLNALLYARGNAERSDYKPNQNKDKYCDQDCNKGQNMKSKVTEIGY